MNTTRLLLAARTSFRAPIRAPRLAITPFVQQQCRTIYLYYAIKAKTTLGAHDVKNWLPYEFPPPTKVEIKIKPFKSTKQIKALDRQDSLAIQNLQDAASKMQTGAWIIFNSDQEAGKTATNLGEAKEKTYAICELKTTAPTKSKKANKKASKGPGDHRKVFFTPDNANKSYFAHMMQKMYMFMDENRAVEVSLTAKTPAGLGRMVKENPHVHPHAILAAMPKFSGLIVKPFTNGSKIAWVMKGPEKRVDGELQPPKNETGHFEHFKDQVLADLKLSAEKGSRPDVVDSAVAISRSEESRRKRIENMEVYGSASQIAGREGREALLREDAFRRRDTHNSPRNPPNNLSIRPNDRVRNLKQREGGFAWPKRRDEKGGMEWKSGAPLKDTHGKHFGPKGPAMKREDGNGRTSPLGQRILTKSHLG